MLTAGDLRYAVMSSGRRLLHGLASDLYRARAYRQSGARVHGRARILGAAAISLGDGTIVHDDATIASTSLGACDTLRTRPEGRVTLGQSCEIGRGVILASYCGWIEMGDDCSVHPYSILYGHGGLRIGSSVRIAAHAVIIPANHGIADVSTPIRSQSLTCRGIDIEDDVWIGAGARILDGVTIGRGAVIGAGAVVTRNVPSGTVVAGVPAKVIATRGNLSAAKVA